MEAEIHRLRADIAGLHAEQPSARVAPEAKRRSFAMSQTKSVFSRRNNDFVGEVVTSTAKPSQKQPVENEVRSTMRKQPTAVRKENAPSVSSVSSRYSKVSKANRRASGSSSDDEPDRNVSFRKRNQRSFDRLIDEFRMSSISARSDNYPTVDYEHVKKLKDDPNYILIDVRQPQELIYGGAIPGAINIPLDTFGEVLTNMTESDFKLKYGRDKPGKNFNIIVSCRGATRSAKAQKLAIGLGFKKVFNYSGGILDWNRHNK